MRLFGWFRKKPVVVESSWLPDLQFAVPESGIYELRPAMGPSDLCIETPGYYRVVKIRPVVVESEDRIVV